MGSDSNPKGPPPDGELQQWQRSNLRTCMRRYRESLEQSNYYSSTTRLLDLGDGVKAFSVINPPLASPPAVRRIRLMMRDITRGGTTVAEDGTVSWGQRTPHYMTVAVTYDCQCDCVHCSADSYRQAVRTGDGALTLDELKAAVAQTVELGTTCVVLTGGEPLLLDGLDELIASVDPQLSIVTMFTNGGLLDDEAVARLRQAGLFGAFVSLDSTDPARHDELRCRPGLFDKAVAAIRRCREAGIVTGISTYADGERLRSGELDAIMELGRELDVLEVFVFDLIASGKLLGERERMLAPDDVQAMDALRRCYNDDPDYPHIIHESMFTDIAYPCVGEGCPAGVATVHLRANGDVSPCDFAPFSFGNIRERPFADIWREMAAHAAFAHNSPGCRLADQAYWDQLGDLASPR